MRVRHDTINISPFIALHNYDPAMFWDVEGDVFKREAPAVRKRIEKILVIRKQLDIHLKRAREI